MADKKDDSTVVDTWFIVQLGNIFLRTVNLAMDNADDFTFSFKTGKAKCYKKKEHAEKDAKAIGGEVMQVAVEVGVPDKTEEETNVVETKKSGRTSKGSKD